MENRNIKLFCKRSLVI